MSSLQSAFESDIFKELTTGQPTDFSLALANISANNIIFR